MPASHEVIAQRLRAAYDGVPVEPLRDGLAPNAYAVQTINTMHWVAQGRRIVGRKIGFTSELVQRQLGVNQPDFGVIFDDTLIGDGETLHRKMQQPKIEAEIALVLGKDLLQVAPTSLDVLAAVECVLPALEVVDSRIAEWKITLADTVADNASSAGHPLHSAAWLARTLRQRGEPLPAGDLVVTAALGPMVALPNGAHVQATIGGLGTVSLDVGELG
jgi:2-keto-4-pentenoate hydratase